MGVVATRWAVLGLVVLATASSACAGSGSPDSGSQASVSPTPSVPAAFTDAGTAPYRADVPSLTSRLLMPDEAGTTVPLVVLVPGGGWASADPSGLAPLAETLAGQGLAVATTTYRTSSDGSYFPVPVDDVVCAVDDAAARVRSSGATPSPVVVVGHSAGAQLAALAALVGREHQDDCASPLLEPDGFVGLAGPYDVVAAESVAHLLFIRSAAEDPGTWSDGNPVDHAAQRPRLRVVLVHGDADTVVPPSSSEDFAAALREGGHDVRLLLLPGSDHSDVYQPADAADPIAQLVADLQEAQASPAASG